ncbi:mitochondrial 2-enoyl thioester reductase [Coemansia sp. RSA 552]|nr:mitochondrial 2-enoyl thioester reductase [Coemansia sp. RSA 552]
MSGFVLARGLSGLPKAGVRGLQALAAVYKTTGEPQQVVEVVERTIPDDSKSLGQGQVVVQMLAAPVNPSDLNQIEGKYPVRGTFSSMQIGDQSIQAAVGGNEGVGEVVQVGHDVTGLQAGDWVVPQQAGVFGTWCTHAVAGASGLLRIPRAWREKVRPVDVACLKVNSSTAYRLLRDFVGLQPGDYVIQNGANSAVGRAVIQLARNWGIRTINVVRERAEGGGLLAQQLRALGADMVVTDTQLSDKDTAREIKALEPRLGLNCVGGRATMLMTKLIGPNGKLVSYGGMSGKPVSMPTSLLLFKNISAHGFWMNRWYDQALKDAALGEEQLRMWEDILAMTSKKQFTPEPVALEQWPVGSLQQTQELVATAVAWGSPKTVFTFGPSA